MIIIGHPLVEYLPFYEIISLEDIKNTPPNSRVIFEFDAKMANYCQKNGVSFAMKIKDKQEAVLSNALEADFIVVEKEIAKEVQSLAEDYIFDSKVLLLAVSESDFEWAIESRIDGILFEKAVKRV